MPVFHYRALTPSGEVETGTLDLPDEASAVAQLQAKGLLPVKIDRTGEGWFLTLMNMEITPKGALSARERLVFTRTLATLLGASLPLDRALRTIESLGTSKPVRQVAGRLLESVSGGRSLADALDGEAKTFPRLYRAIVRAGETGAAIEETLARLADLLEENAKRRGDLRSAMIYPSFLIVTAIGSVSILMAFVVPTFKPLLDDAGVQPPAITEFVIATGDFFAEYGLSVLIGLLIAVFLIASSLRAAPIRLAWHRFALRIPILGRLWREFETATFSRLLGAMLQNGVALPAALRLVREVQGNMAFVHEIDRVIPAVEDGRGLSGVLEEGQVLSPLARQLIGVGQESGRLTEMLVKAAEILEADFKRAFDQLLATLTPVLTLIMGGMVAVIISSILFALFSINELAL